MHYLTGVPSAVAIPVVVEPGKLAGPAKPGATHHAQPGAAALPLEISFRARLQTMFTADIRATKTAESPIDPAITKSQDSVARDGVSPPSSTPARLAPQVSPITRTPQTPPTPARPVLHDSLSTLSPQPLATLALPAAPQLANQRTDPGTDPGSPQPVSVSSSPSFPRPVREKSSHSGMVGDPSSPSPVLVSAGTLPESLLTPSPAPVPQPLAPALRVEGGSKTTLAETSEAAMGSVSARAVAPPSLTEPPERSVSSGPPKPIVAHSAAHSAAILSTPDSSPPLEDAATPAASSDGGDQMHPAPVSSDSAAPVPRQPVERATKSQPASAIGPAPSLSAAHGVANPSDSPSAASAVPPAEPKAGQPARASSASRLTQSTPAQNAVASGAPAAAQPGTPPAHAFMLSVPRESTNSPSGATPAPADTFAALDTEPAAPPATWIHAGSTHAEAGYLDPSLGWVAVRAGVAGNTFHASILPSSAEAAQALGSHLDGLNSYLADHRVAAAQLTIAPLPSGQSLAGQSGFGPSGQQAGQEQRGGEPPVGSSSDSTLTRTADASSAPPVNGFEAAADPVWSGGHISVIA